MTRKDSKSGSVPKPVRDIPLEIEKRIRIFAAARNLSNIDFFEQYTLKIMEYLDTTTPEKGSNGIAAAADIVIGVKIYPYSKNEGGRKFWAIRIRNSFYDEIFKFAHLTTGSVESFIRETIIQIGQRLPPSEHVIRGFNRRRERKEDNGSRAEVAEQNWDGHVDVAPDPAEGPGEF